jgi:hypothetical protein
MTWHDAAAFSSVKGKPLLLLYVVVAAADGERGDLGESKGVELGVEPVVNCQTRVNLVISSGMDRGFFTTMPTATGSAWRDQNSYSVQDISWECI